MIFLVRHGERSDKVEKEKYQVEIKYDPNLTNHGTNQALATGLFIQEKVEEAAKFEILLSSKQKYFVISSPFLRCVQTAYHLINGLGKDAEIINEVIHIDDGLGEKMKSSYFDQDILPDLYIRKHSLAKIGKYVDYGLKDEWMKDGIKPLYPESKMAYISRITLAYRTLKKQIWKEIGYKDAIIIMVTHAIACEVILQDKKEFDSFKGNIGLCSVQQFYYNDPENNDDRCKVLLSQYHDHAIIEKKNINI